MQTVTGQQTVDSAKIRSYAVLKVDSEEIKWRLLNVLMQFLSRPLSVFALWND